MYRQKLVYDILKFILKCKERSSINISISFKKPVTFVIVYLNFTTSGGIRSGYPSASHVSVRRSWVKGKEFLPTVLDSSGQIQYHSPSVSKGKERGVFWEPELQ